MWGCGCGAGAAALLFTYSSGATPWPTLCGTADERIGKTMTFDATRSAVSSMRPVGSMTPKTFLVGRNQDTGSRKKALDAG